jgi:hypothetical protein
MPCSTIGDGGKLRRIAESLPPEAAAPAAPQAMPAPAAGAPARRPEDPPPAPIWLNQSPAARQQPPGYAMQGAAVAPQKKKAPTSLIAKLTLALLPFAIGLVVIAKPFAPRVSVQAAKPAASLAAKAAASNAPAVGAKAKATASANKAAPLAKSTATAPSTAKTKTVAAAKAEPPATKPEATPKPEAAPKEAAPKAQAPANATAQSASDTREAAKIARAALEAALEGRMSEAEKYYTALASESSDPVYALAARHVAAGAISKP